MWTGIARAARHYAFCFLVFGGSFAILPLAVRRDAAEAIEAGAFYGFWMAAIIGSRSLWRSRGNPDTRARARRSLAVAADPDQVAAAARRALHHQQARILADDGRHLAARTPASWQTWGQRLTVDVSAIPGGASVHIASTPRMWLTAVDYGRGNRQVDSLARELAAPL
jgi:hypothetical protein